MNKINFGGEINPDGVLHFHPVPKEQFQATYNDVISVLSHQGCIAITGNDAAKFLQGQVTANVTELSDTQSRLGAHCNPKGRILCSFRIVKFQDNFYLYLPVSMVEPTLIALKKYAVFFKVKLEDITSSWYQIGLSGPHAVSLLEEIIGKIPNEIDATTLNSSLHVMHERGHFPRFSIGGDCNAIQLLWQQLREKAMAVGPSAWELLDILAGSPAIMPETIGVFTPHEINFDKLNGVSFNKGCYTGQEIVARMHYLGKLKRHLYQIEFEHNALALPGTKLLVRNNDSVHEVGQLVNIVASSVHSYTALAVINATAISEIICLENEGPRIRVHSPHLAE